MGSGMEVGKEWTDLGHSECSTTFESWLKIGSTETCGRGADFTKTALRNVN